MSDRQSAISNQLDRLRKTQRECADAALAAQTEREREYAMLGVNDNLVEELMLLYWMDAIGGKLSAISGQQSAE